MRFKIIPIIIVIVFTATFIIFFKGLKNSNIYTPNVDLEKKVPSLVFKSFDTNLDIISENIFNKNKFYLVNIWASWCIPCRDEHKFLMDLKKNKKIELIGFNYKDNFKNATSFLKDLGNPYNIIVSDKDGIASINWGAYGVPESFLIYENKIIKRFIGPINNEDLLEIKKIIR